MKIFASAALCRPMAPFGLLALIALLDAATPCPGEDGRQLAELTQRPPADAQEPGDSSKIVTGVVRDASGVPVADASVTFFPAMHPGMFLRAKARTDSNGCYHFTLQTTPNGKNAFFGPTSRMSSIMARCPERNLAAMVEFEQVPTNLDLNLQPGITICGLVMDAKTVPIPCASFKLIFICDHLSFELDENPINVDAAGRFTVPGLPQGRDYISYPRITAEGYGGAYLHLDAAHSCTNHYECPPMVLKRANCMLAGLALGDDGKPVSGATVDLSGDGQRDRVQIRTDTTGHFCFEGICPGKVWLNGIMICPDNRVMSTKAGVEEAAEAGDTNVVLRLWHQDTSPGNAH